MNKVNLERLRMYDIQVLLYLFVVLAYVVSVPFISRGLWYLFITCVSHDEDDLTYGLFLVIAGGVLLASCVILSSFLLKGSL